MDASSSADAYAPVMKALDAYCASKDLPCKGKDTCELCDAIKKFDHHAKKDDVTTYYLYSITACAIYNCGVTAARHLPTAQLLLLGLADNRPAAIDTVVSIFKTLSDSLQKFDPTTSWETLSKDNYNDFNDITNDTVLNGILQKNYSGDFPDDYKKAYTKGLYGSDRASHAKQLLDTIQAAQKALFTGPCQCFLNIPSK